MPSSDKDVVVDDDLDDDVDLATIGEAVEAVVSWVRRASPRWELSAVALSSLDALARIGPLRVTDLVARERISQPGMTAIVARLCDAGLVERRADPADRRVSIVSVTSEGLAYLRSAHETRTAILVDHLRELPAEHRRALRAAVAALKALSSR